MTTPVHLRLALGPEAKDVEHSLSSLAPIPIVSSPSMRTTFCAYDLSNAPRRNMYLVSVLLQPSLLLIFDLALVNEMLER